jgi:prophage antirepressor-like protein
VAAGFGLGQVALEPLLADGTAPVLARAAPAPRHDEIEILRFDGKDVRTIWLEGEQWWVAADVCADVGIANVSDAVSGLDADEKGIAKTDTVVRGRQQMAIVNEPGLYHLLSRSNKAKARAFWR